MENKTLMTDFYIKTKKGRIGQNEKNLSTKEETKKQSSRF